MPKKRKQNSAETDWGSYHNQEECLEEFLDDKAAFYNNSESDEACNFFKNRLQHRCVTMKFCKPFKDTFFTEHMRWLLLQDLQELINNFAICKHSNGTLLVQDVTSTHGFGNYNYIFQKGVTLFHRSRKTFHIFMLYCNIKCIYFLTSLVTSSV